MTDTTQGVVARSNSKETKLGYTTYSFTLEGDERWFGTFKTPAPAVGTNVSFDYTTSGSFFNVKDLKTNGDVAPRIDFDDDIPESVGGSFSQPAAPAKPAGKDANFQWRAAREAAIATAAFLMPMNAEALKEMGVGRTDGHGFSELIAKLTLEYFDEAMEVNATGDAPEAYRGAF